MPTVVFKLECHSVAGVPEDGAFTTRTELGTYSSLRVLARTLRDLLARDAIPGVSLASDGHVSFSADAITLDVVGERPHVFYFDRRGSLRGDVRVADFGKPWRGLPEAKHVFRAGELVEYVGDGEYRLGVVLEPPPTPAQAKRLPAPTRGDDVYLVGHLEADTAPHIEVELLLYVPAPMLLPVERTLELPLRRALELRYARYAEVTRKTA